MTALCFPITSAADDLWHSDVAADRELAARICGFCDARLTCLAGAVARGETFGCWGGVDMEQREADRLTAQMAAGFLEVRAEVHGRRSLYVSGCRCAPCTAENARTKAEYEQRRAVVTGAPTMDQQMDLLEGIGA
ncbi:MAG: WhiB family transcriptional regulator [Hyphomicrobiales bacterium]|nr:WhiB family transcriptional regulator [Hyphomicrobiales bacterium]